MELKRGASGASARSFLESGHAFIRADRVLSRLEPSVAVTFVEGAAHTIADHVGHMAWWQRQVLADIRSETRARSVIGGDEFRSVPLEDWESVRQDFLSGLEELKTLTDDAALLGHQYLSRDHDVAFVLMDFALHNAYHLGQIVLLRRLLGAWPPAGYEETW